MILKVLPRFCGIDLCHGFPRVRSQMLLGEEVLDVKQHDISKNNLYLFAVRQILQVRTDGRTEGSLLTALIRARLC